MCAREKNHGQKIKVCNQGERERGRSDAAMKTESMCVHQPLMHIINTEPFDGMEVQTCKQAITKNGE